MKEKISPGAAVNVAVKRKRGVPPLIHPLTRENKQENFIMALPKTEGSPDDQDHVRYEYTNQGKMPEYNLALYIVGTLAAQGLINVSSSVGYELVEHATEVVARCLEGLTNDHRARFGNDQLFDFVMSKP